MTISPYSYVFSRTDSESSAEKHLGEYQRSFRPGRSTVDQIFVLRQIVGKAKEYQKAYHTFIDIKATYDSIIRGKLSEAMNEPQIRRKNDNVEAYMKCPSSRPKISAHF